MMYQNQKVQLSVGGQVYTMPVNSKNGPLESSQGSVRVNGEIVPVEYSLSLDVWKRVQKSKKQ